MKLGLKCWDYTVTDHIGELLSRRSLIEAIIPLSIMVTLTGKRDSRHPIRDTNKWERGISSVLQTAGEVNKKSKLLCWFDDQMEL